MKTLLLLTSWYPLNNGDAAFVVNEIDQLAAGFDQVLVFNHTWDVQRPAVPTPENVRYLGTLSAAIDKGPLPKQLLGMLRHPAYLARVLSIYRRENRAGRTRGQRAATMREAVNAARMALVIRPHLRGAGDVSVYAFWAWGAGVALAGLPRVRGSKVLRIHSFDLYEEVLGHLPLRASLFGIADSIIPISNHGADYLRERYPAILPDGKLQVMRLGTPDCGIGPTPASSEPLRVVSCSTVNQVKRVERILEVAAYLAQQTPVRWTHLGGGPLLEQLRASEAMDAPGLTVDLRGALSKEEVMEALTSEPFHVFVNQSTREGVPVSIMEALSCGIPVVAPNIGGIEEIVGEDLGSGRMVSATASIPEVSEAVLGVAANRSSYSPREVWSRLYRADHNALQVLNLLTQ